MRTPQRKSSSHVTLALFFALALAGAPGLA